MLFTSSGSSFGVVPDNCIENIEVLLTYCVHIIIKQGNIPKTLRFVYEFLTKIHNIWIRFKTD